MPTEGTATGLADNILVARRLLRDQDCQPNAVVRIPGHTAALLTFSCPDPSVASDEAAGVVLIGGAVGNLVSTRCQSVELVKTSTGGFLVPVRDGKAQALVFGCRRDAHTVRPVAARLDQGLWRREAAAPDNVATGKVRGPAQRFVFESSEGVSLPVCAEAACAAPASVVVAPTWQAWDGERYARDLSALTAVYAASLGDLLARAAPAASASASPAASASAPTPPTSASAASPAPSARARCPIDALRLASSLVAHARLAGERLEQATSAADAVAARSNFDDCRRAGDTAPFWPAARQKVLDATLPRLAREARPDAPLSSPDMVEVSPGPRFPACARAPGVPAPRAQRSTDRPCRVTVSRAARGDAAWQRTSWRRIATLGGRSVSSDQDAGALARGVCEGCCGPPPWIVTVSTKGIGAGFRADLLVDESPDGTVRSRTLWSMDGPYSDCAARDNGGPLVAVAGSDVRYATLVRSNRITAYMKGIDRGTIVCPGPIEGCASSCLGDNTPTFAFFEPSTWSPLLQIGYVDQRIEVGADGLVDPPAKDPGEPYLWFTTDADGVTVHGETCEGPRVPWTAAR